MQRAVLAIGSILVLQAACHPKPPKQKSGADDFTAPAPAGKEEKWTEPEEDEAPKPKPKPPPPLEPTSPPPAAGLGFEFGLAKDDAVRKCSKRGTWSKRGGSYTCSRPLEGASFPGKPVLSFCDQDKLCAVGVAIVVEGSDYAAWGARFEEMKQALVALHGPPTVETQNVADTCKNEGFVKCLDGGTASAEVTWKWKTGHRVTLSMKKKKGDDGPSAIRFVSIVNG